MMTKPHKHVLMHSNSHSHGMPRRSQAKAGLQLLLTIVIIAAAVLNASAQAGYLFVSSNLGEYRLDGSIVNASLIPGLDPYSLAVSGTNIYAASTDNQIGKYSTSGKTINASLITGPAGAVFFGIAISGTNLFVANFVANGTVVEYTTAGTPVVTNILTFNYPAALAISGSNIYVGVNNEDTGIANRGTIAELTTSGYVVNQTLITNLSEPAGIAISGTNIFVSNSLSDKIGEYTTSGQTINASLITGLSGPAGIAISGTNLYVVNYFSGTISEYSTSGQLINPALITNLSYPFGLALNFVPQLNAAPATAIGNQTALYYPIWASNYVVQGASNLASPAWADVTDGAAMTCVVLTNSPPANGAATAYRLVPAQ